MILELHLSEEQVQDIVARVAAMTVKERAEPYTVAEAALALNLSTKSIRRYVDAGTLPRVPNTDKVLIPAPAVHARQQGRIAAKEVKLRTRQRGGDGS